MSANDERPEPANPVSRRGLLGKGAGAAVAGIGLAVLATEPAHAAPGDPFVLGEANNAGANATDLASTNNFALRVINHNTESGVAIRAQGRALGLAALTTSTGDPATDLGTGVLAQGAYGVQAIGRRLGLRAAGPVPLRLEPAQTDGPPTAGSHFVGDVYTDVRGHVYVCAAEGTPGVWVQPGFNPVDPFRVVDTRFGVGAPSSAPIGPGQEIEVAFWGVGGVVSGATAVTCNLTATAPTAIGFLTVYPSGRAWPGTSNINFVAGQTIANQTTVKLGVGGKVKVFNSTGNTHAIIDLAGFFY